MTGAWGSPRTRRRILRATALLLGFAPAAGLAVAAFQGGLGANPVEKVTLETGEWALRFLVLSLSISPLRRWTGIRELTLERRTLGLFAFGYAALHLGTYVGFDLAFEWALLGEDIAERPYITVGFASFLMLLALAATSSRAAIRKLGRRWKTLHRLAYVAAIGAVVHFLWLVKADLREPLVYGAIVAFLLGFRVWRKLQKRPARLAPSRAPSR